MTRSSPQPVAAACAWVALAAACGGPSPSDPFATANGDDGGVATAVDAAAPSGDSQSAQRGSDGGGPSLADGQAPVGTADAQGPVPTVDGASGMSVSDAASSGCGVASVATGSRSEQVTVGGQTRTYVLSVPTSYSPAVPQPLVFAFHGVGLSGKQVQTMFGLEGTTNTRAIFVYPDALPKASSGNSTDWDYAPTGIDFAFFDALVTKLTTSYCVASNRVFAAGHSAGGIFTNMIGCYRGGVVRAIAPVSSQKPWSTTGGSVQCTGNVAVWIAHGQNDPYSNFTTNGIGARDFWIQQNGCSTSSVTDPATPVACVDYQGCRPGLPVVWCVHGEGHNWPSTSAYACGDASVCFDAGPAIWSFFSGF